MAPSSQQLFPLLDLPNEVISHVFSILDTNSPFGKDINDLPRKPKRVENTPLKQCSLLSVRLRKLALPVLFHHAYLNPQELRSFITFLEKNSLTNHVNTLVAYLPSSCNHYHPPWWSTLLSKTPSLRTISIVAPPHTFTEITGRSMQTLESWAFNIKYQVMSLSRDLSAGTSMISKDEPPYSLLDASPWTSFTLNEGSALKCYTTYEYFLRRTPSPIYTIPTTTASLPPLPNPFLANLLSFSYVAIFPIYNHVEQVMARVKQMKQLRKLFIKLIPEPDSTILNDEINAAIGHFDVNDPWTEFETALALVAGTCRILSEASDLDQAERGSGGNLEELQVDDVKMLGMKDDIEDIININLTGESINLGWEYKGEGTWKRSSSPPVSIQGPEHPAKTPSRV